MSTIILVIIQNPQWEGSNVDQLLVVVYSFKTRLAVRVVAKLFLNGSVVELCVFGLPSSPYNLILQRFVYSASVYVNVDQFITVIWRRWRQLRYGNGSHTSLIEKQDKLQEPVQFSCNINWIRNNIFPSNELETYF